jgi:hypothetical protein
MPPLLELHPHEALAIGIACWVLAACLWMRHGG